MQNPSAWHVDPEKNEIRGKYMALTFHIVFSHFDPPPPTPGKWSRSLLFISNLGLPNRHNYITYQFSSPMHWWDNTLMPYKIFSFYSDFHPSTQKNWSLSLPFNRFIGHPNGYKYVAYHFSPPMQWWDNALMPSKTLSTFLSHLTPEKLVKVTPLQLASTPPHET